MYRIIDLTRALTDHSLSYPGDRAALETVRVDLGARDARLTHLSFFDLHAGTHVDAPLHFVPGGRDVKDLGIPVRPGLLIRTREQSIPASALPDAPLDGRAVLFDTGWERDLSSAAYFDRFPFISARLAQALVERGAGIVGIDTPSADSQDAAPDYPTHRTLLTAGIPIVEGLTHLDALASIRGDWLFAIFPLPVDGMEGAPVRAVALVPTDS
jgi:arylformamidase